MTDQVKVGALVGLLIAATGAMLLVTLGGC